VDFTVTENTRRTFFMEKITKDTIIGDILQINPNSAPILMEMGMHCLGCPASRGESIEAACRVHGTDADELVNQLNEYFANKS
jgi:hybrid cluster-associated redox disulfide protein